ncbi:hypothetical protein GOV10_06550, partial [Candidatus Woesearchaeota archaeon]|nr:hypothetical protein [Candidatus Woesearchaeota archaeon]
MKGIMILVLFLVSLTAVSALSAPASFNGKTYYVVTSTDVTEDTGAEVCAKAGMVCNGYTEPTNGVCKLVHPGIATSTGWSGDLAGTYCNGAPQNGVCAGLTNSCLTCPACTNTVSCTTPIGNLYREMYVECTAGACSVSIGATTVAQFMNQIAGLNTQFSQCPPTLPAGSSVLFKNGITLVTINMNGGG